MSIWKKRNSSIKTLDEFVEKSVNMPLSKFLNPTPDPYIKDLAEAVAFVKESIAKGNKVSVVADYDADGVMGAAILKMVIEEYTGNVPYVRIPKRRAEGYGLSMNIVDEIDSGLVITVDNGIAAVDQVAKAKAKGLDVVVLDHHGIREDGLIPKADVVVDPSAIPGSAFNDYCGAALAYRFAKELIPNSKNLDKMLVFASIATVADVMELVGDNRNIVRRGLELVNQRKVTQGFNTLLNVLNVNYANEETYGFKIGPVINASGRLFDDGPDDVLRLITNDCNVFDDDQMAANEELAKVLEKRNTMRQDMVKNHMAIAHQIIEEQNLTDNAIMMVYSPDFDEGIVGIVAGNLTEEYHRPAIAFTDGKKAGVMKGSARNYGDTHMKEMCDYAKELFLSSVNDKGEISYAYGGHKGAAGMSVPKENLDALRNKMNEYLKNTGFDYEAESDTTYYDLELPEIKVTETIKRLNELAPFGQGNPRPIFKIEGYSLAPKGADFVKVMGKDKNHLKFFGKYTDAVGFDMVKAYEEAGRPKTMNVLGNLSQNFYQGKFYNQIEVLEFEPITVETKTKTMKTLEDLLIF